MSPAEIARLIPDAQGVETVADVAVGPLGREHVRMRVVRSAGGGAQLAGPAPVQRTYPGSKTIDPFRNMLGAEHFDDTEAFSPRTLTDQYRERKAAKKAAETLYKISDVAELFGRNVPSVRKWEREGVFPKTPIRLNGQRRYSAQMLDGLRKIDEEIGVSVNSQMSPQKREMFKLLTFALFEQLAGDDE